LRAALQLGHNYIGTEHVLLGLVSEGEGVGAQILTATVDGGLDTVRDTVGGLMGEAVPAGLSEGLKHMSRGLRGRLERLSVSPPSEDELRKRLEAIEARLSAIEALLREQHGKEEVS
jgi:hypothetical protein